MSTSFSKSKWDVSDSSRNEQRLLSPRKLRRSKKSRKLLTIPPMKSKMLKVSLMILTEQYLLSNPLSEVKPYCEKKLQLRQKRNQTALSKIHCNKNETSHSSNWLIRASLSRLFSSLATWRSYSQHLSKLIKRRWIGCSSDQSQLSARLKKKKGSRSGLHRQLMIKSEQLRECLCLKATSNTRIVFVMARKTHL